jgi:hypothetical protein
MDLLQRREAAAGQLSRIRRMSMSQLNIREELQKAPAEPLLPIEKKLIGFSLGTGLVLLIILVVINHFLPVTL